MTKDQKVINDFNDRFTGHSSGYFRDRYLAELIRRDELCKKLRKKGQKVGSGAEEVQSR